MNEQENRNAEQQEKDLYTIGKDLFEKAKTKLVGEEQPENSAARSLKVIGKAIIIFFVVGGCIGGGIFGTIEEPLFGDEGLDTVVLGLLGAIAGLIVGYLISLFFRYFAELGENTKITAQTTKAVAQQSENDETNNAVALKKYKELLDSGIITQEEFDVKKKQILGL